MPAPHIPYKFIGDHIVWIIADGDKELHFDTEGEALNHIYAARQAKLVAEGRGPGRRKGVTIDPGTQLNLFGGENCRPLAAHVWRWNSCSEHHSGST